MKIESLLFAANLTPTSAQVSNKEFKIKRNRCEDNEIQSDI
jgi:hypothetical protein